MKSVRSVWLTVSLVLTGAAALAQAPMPPAEGGEGGLRRGMRPGLRAGGEHPILERAMAERGMAERGGGGDGEGRVLKWLIQDERIQKELGLSDEQVAGMRKQTLENQKQLIELKAKLELAALDQVELLRAEEPDESALMKAIEKTGALRTEIAKLELKHLLAVRGTLTAEQRHKLRQMVKDKIERVREQRGEGGPGPERGAPDHGPQPPPMPRPAHPPAP
jgi:Spy/CpxP family protein refolding chaperone